MRGDAGGSQSHNNLSPSSLSSRPGWSHHSLDSAMHSRSGCETPQRNSHVWPLVATQAAQAEDEGDEDYDGEGCVGSPNPRRLTGVNTRWYKACASR